MKIPRLLVVLISVSWLAVPAQADWPGWGPTHFARWTGYGFGDGYHHGPACSRCYRQPWHGVGVPAADGWAAPTSRLSMAEPPATWVAR